MSFIDKAKKIIEPVLDELNYELVDITYKNEFGNMTLTIYIDNEEGNISHIDCEKVSNALDNILEEANLSEDKLYHFNVFSPGLDRELKTKKDYERNINKNVDISTYTLIEIIKEKKIKAKLLSYNDDDIIVEYKNKKIKLGYDNIAKINQSVDF